MVATAVHLFFIATIPFALIGFFFLSRFVVLYSGYKSVLHLQNIPNTRTNNQLLNFSLYSIALFFLAAGCAQVVQGNGKQAVAALIGAVLFTLFAVVLVGSRMKDLQKPEKMREKYQPVNVLWKIPTNPGERLQRLLFIFLLGVIFLAVVIFQGQAGS